MGSTQSQQGFDQGDVNRSEGRDGGLNSTAFSSASASSRGHAQPSSGNHGWSFPGRNSSWLSFGMSEGEGSDEEGIEDEQSGHCCPCGVTCTAKKSRPGLCYFCFVFYFFSFLLIFPLFFKWLKISPMPSQYWNEEFDRFPALEDKHFIKDYEGMNYRISMSEIPKSYHGCNFSCVGQWNDQNGGEVSFPMELNLDAQGFDHNAYPVILASNDFGGRWWVAADRTDAVTEPFFPSNTETLADIYRHETDECTRPPEVKRSFVESEEPLLIEDGFSSVPIYLMACITWDWDSMMYFTNVSEIGKEEIGKHCQAVGGVCGWPCEGGPEFNNLPGCSSGIINVDSDTGAFADMAVPGADFSGLVHLHGCMNGVGTEECQTMAAPLSDWPCHTCAVRDMLFNVEVEPGVYLNKTFQHQYQSLPKLQLTLEDVKLKSTNAVPRAYFFTTTVDVQNSGPDGMHNGQWKKLYYDYDMVVSDPHRYPYPLPLEFYDNMVEEVDLLCLNAPWIPECQNTVPPYADNYNRRLSEAGAGGSDGRQLSEEPPTPSPLEFKSYKPNKFFRTPMLLDATTAKMDFIDKAKVVLKPAQCFTARGAIYLVACAVNESTYQGGFRFREGQEVAPPPFNDRCLAVSGKCAYACMGEQEPQLKFCDSQGNIPKDMLFWDYEIPKNDTEVVIIFMVSLIVGFAVKLMTYCPGLFLPDKNPQFYNPRQTEHFKYIAVVMPSGGESKAVCIRNMVGAMSALPVGCDCPYHVVFADEGHRHPHKVAFRALVDVLQAVPESRMTHMKDPDAGNLRNRLGRMTVNWKEDNLKSFTKAWVESIRNYTLKDCNTAQMYQRAQRLQEEKTADPAAQEEANEINSKLDRLCGKAALQKLHERNGWPTASENPLINKMETAIQNLRAQLTVGEKEVYGEVAKAEPPKAMHLDDTEAYWWQPGGGRMEENDRAKRLYTMHYVGRARPDEDERTLKVQHVARGTWYYRIPRDEDARLDKTWLEWRERAQVYQDGDSSERWFVVPVRTSRGKAGGLNFVENYLYDYTRTLNRMDPILKYALFAIADARHQFQPDFFHETIPFFFKQNNTELDVSVAYTQSPQYFPEMKDDVDYLDNNNANFFRLNCMLRNCCGGVSSCGTNGTWLVRDRRAGFKGSDSVWEEKEEPRLDFVEKIERRFFNETCKVEDTASSLDRVVKGKYSKYVNMRLSYGMAKDPTDYLAAVQRWSEGGVVLSLQTFLGCREGVHMVWMAWMLFLLFIASLINLVYGWGYIQLWYNVSFDIGGDDRMFTFVEGLAEGCADWFVDINVAHDWFRDGWVEIFLDVFIWFIVIMFAVVCLSIVTAISFFLHYLPCCMMRKRVRRTRFPTSMAQWARLAITLDNLTYFLWFWTAFFWIGFNYYGVWGRRWYHFEANGMVLFSYLVQVLGWSLVIAAAARYRTEQGHAFNEVFFLSLTNVWRTTQLFYITAPLTLYSLLMGTSDFVRHRMLHVDISYWVGGDRGATSRTIAQWWTLILIFGAIISHIFFWSGWLEYAEFGGLLIVTFIALDVAHPCAYLWLSVAKEKLPTPPPMDWPKWQRCPYRFFQLLFSGEMYRNVMRAIIFHPRSTFFVKWIGPIQNCVFPVLTFAYPELGVNQALLLLASSRT